VTPDEVVLGGVIDIVLSLDPKFAGSNPAEDEGLLMAIKIRSTTSFGGEVKPSAPCRNILWHIKNPAVFEEIPVGKIHGHFSPSFSPLRY
jgi:hypothetical protein